MSSPYREGRYAQIERNVRKGALCQALIGKVVTLMDYDAVTIGNQCQALIGKVVTGNSGGNSGGGYGCQALIGKVVTDADGLIIEPLVKCVKPL